MKKLLLLAFAALLQPIYAQEIIREWNFNDSLKTATQSTDSIQIIGEISSSLKRISTKNIVLNTTSYPAKDQKNMTQGIQFITSTAGFSQIQLTTTLKFSSTAANTWVLQACTNPDATPQSWQNVDTLGAFAKSGSNIQTSSDLSYFPEINNKAKIAFRLVSSFAIGSTQYAPISATPYSTKGTVQFDNIILKGTKEASSTCNEISTKTSNIQVVKQTGFSGILRWNKGEGDSTLVLLSNSPTLSQVPTTEKAYPSSSNFAQANATIGNATIISTQNNDSSIIRNLRPGQTYYVFIYDIYCNPAKYTSSPTTFNFTTPTLDQHPEIYINEFMADNSLTITDDKGLYKDWIELYTPNSFSLDLTGYFLSNDINTLTKCKIKENQSHYSNENGYYELFWADGTTTLSDTHLNFELRKDGGTIYLTAPDSITILDSVSYPALTKDQVYQRNGDANENWIKSNKATPTTSNTTQTVGIKENTRNDIKIWPNPIKRGQILYLNSEQNLEIINNTGIKVQSLTKATQINTTNLNAGIYYLRLENGIIKSIIVL
jgi:hypothetical protein